jgi:hypothetical protein
MLTELRVLGPAKRLGPWRNYLVPAFFAARFLSAAFSERTFAAANEAFLCSILPLVF